MLTQTDFQARRHALFAALPENSLAIIAAADEVTRNADTNYPFRQDSDFFYLTGLTEPNAVVIFNKTDTAQDYIVFCAPHDTLKAQWQGAGLGIQGAVAHGLADEAFSLDDLAEKLPELLKGKACVVYSLAHDVVLDELITEAMDVLRQTSRDHLSGPTQFMDLRPVVHEMRVLKSDKEIQLMRRAAEISASAHRRAMVACKVGMYEYELEAELQAIFYRNGSRFPAYPPIVASGDNACVLHYTENDRKMQAGDLVLIDAGCEYQHYASDITRTFPVGGQFSQAQRQIYELVLDTHQQLLDMVKPGLLFSMLQERAIALLTAGLIKLACLHGSVEENIQEKTYKRFFMHSVSHWLGLDVHDAGTYQLQGQSRPLEPGMVFTIEPGLYIPAHKDVPAAFHGIGVRIEDDILVTSQGKEVLSAAVPTSVSDIEALMRS